MSERDSEVILAALLAALEDTAPTGCKVARNLAVPTKIPAGGVIILRDGTPGEPEVLLSPLVYQWTHIAEIDVLIEAPDASRDAAFDVLLTAVATAITSDRTLGGLVDWLDAANPATLDLAEEGAETIKAATVAVTLHYDTQSPLG